MLKFKKHDKLEHLMSQVPVNENNHWLFFGHGEGWGNKCTRCFRQVEQTGKPGLECINCWKFEIWTDNLTDVTETLVYFLEEAQKDPTLHGKLMKQPHLLYESGEDRLGSGVSHSFPDSAKPDRYLAGEIGRDRIFLIYNQSIAERDRRMNKIIGDLKARGLYKKDIAPYRRGCIQPHESIIGPWENWYQLDKDYEK
jgi:hypothetical protein